MNKDLLKQYEEIDWNALLRKDLGSHSLKGAKASLNRIKQIFDDILGYENVYVLSRNYLTIVGEELVSWIDFCEEIKKFGDTAEKQNFIYRISQKETNIFNALSQVISYVQTFDPRKNEQIKEIDEKVTEVQETVKKTKEKVTEVQNFQDIFKELRDEYKKGEGRWFWASIVMVIVVISSLLYLILCREEGFQTLYPIYIFLSIITFIIIRQYTNAKQLRIEASNRLAMAKMFEKIQQTKDNQHYQDFIPKIIDSIAYSMRKNQQESITPISEVIKHVKE